MLLFDSIGVASATDYYVATWGSDSNPGTEAHGRLFKKPLIPWLQAIPFTSKRGPTMKKLYPEFRKPRELYYIYRISWRYGHD